MVRRNELVLIGTKAIHFLEKRAGLAVPFAQRGRNSKEYCESLWSHSCANYVIWINRNNTYTGAAQVGSHDLRRALVV